MMDATGRRDILRMVFLTFWGMLTLVLFFCVVLLVNEMVKSGNDPLAAILPESAVDTAKPRSPSIPAAPLGRREVSLFFASEDGGYLVPDNRTIDFGDSTAENCKKAVEALIAGPREGLIPIFPATAQVLGAYLLDDGELVLDFSRKLKIEHARFKSASLEALMVYGVVNTVTQAALQIKGSVAVRRVRFLFDGAAQDTFPAHIDVRGPMSPDQSWCNAPAAISAAAPSGTGR